MLALSLACRGAQLILLTRHSPTDPFLSDYIDDLRRTSNNELIYAEQVDLSSLHSIRLFATKWVDNAPPRRLDMIILAANTMTPSFGRKAKTVDGLEEEWGVNYLANFHLLSILSPAIRAQPPDRDVRVIFATCNSYIGATLDLNGMKTTKWTGRKGYGRSKLATMVLASAFQRHLDAYKRPDKQPNNAKVVIADPGFCRTPGTRRWLSGGSLWGLLVYLICWPVWWLVLKSAEQGAQSFLYAAMEAEIGRGNGARMVKECRVVKGLRREVGDVEVEKGLWEFSEKQVTELEKEGAVRRALAKKEKEEEEKGKGKEVVNGDEEGGIE
jgi:NAD(P)-dependent dehydrogenase (short-subunit alcohol dehydrogenase family)